MNSCFMSPNIFPHCFAIWTSWLLKLKEQQLVLKQKGQLSIKACLDVLPTSGEFWEISGGLHCSLPKKRGLEQTVKG